MRFVKIEPIDRPAVYIDPEYVISIEQTPKNETLIYLLCDISYLTNESCDSVVKKFIDSEVHECKTETVSNFTAVFKREGLGKPFRRVHQIDIAAIWILLRYLWKIR